MLSREELEEGMTKLMGDQYKAKQLIDAVFSELDTDNNGRVDFSGILQLITRIEFQLATINKEKIMTKEKIEKAFLMIDLVLSYH